MAITCALHDAQLPLMAYPRFMTQVDIMEAASDVVDMAEGATDPAEVDLLRRWHDAYVDMVQRLVVSGKHKMWLH